VIRKAFLAQSRPSRISPENIEASIKPRLNEAGRGLTSEVPRTIPRAKPAKADMRIATIG
jgi:hypothetical protein